MTPYVSSGNEAAQELIREIVSRPEFAGREPHWLVQISLWFQTMWESISLGLARATSGIGGVDAKWVDSPILLVFVLASLVVAISFVLGRSRGMFVREIPSGEGNLARVPDESYRRLRQKALRSMARGDSFETLRTAYLAGLRLLWERKLLPQSFARTDREFILSLGHHPTKVPFEQLSNLFSRHRYGSQYPGSEEARVALDLLDQLHARAYEPGDRIDEASGADHVGNVG